MLTIPGFLYKLIRSRTTVLTYEIYQDIRRVLKPKIKLMSSCKGRELRSRHILWGEYYEFGLLAFATQICGLPHSRMLGAISQVLTKIGQNLAYILYPTLVPLILLRHLITFSFCDGWDWRCG